MVVNVVLHICKIDVVLEYVIVYLKPPSKFTYLFCSVCLWILL